MSLKWSKYNFLLDNCQAGTLLYNTYTNGLLSLDNSIFADLKLLKDKGDQECFTSEEIDFFKDNFILVEDDEFLVEQMHHNSMERIFDEKHLVLTIAPTQNCNFSCEYCYEKWRTPGRMSDGTENAIISYLEERIGEGLRTLNLTWYGGEPLMESNRLRSLGNKIIGLGLNILEHEIITNGYLLDRKRFEYLNEIGVETIQVTLDGFKEVHDIRRPLLNGNGTFDKIISNLDCHFTGNLKDCFTIAIRVNIDKTNQDVFWEVYNWLKERYQTDKIVIYPGWIHLDESSSSKCNCFDRDEATDFCLKAYKERGVLLEKLYPDDINIECLVRNPNNMLIGWQGEIYKCFEDLGDADLIVGNQ
ncbi:radical SAM protein [Carboxylicivirga sp. M1479]|uniref:radical SAM protein n=1 Tax=Carboxylicivirga sp. M1479 TaxID=2594476 RepID=UPI001177BCB6|nr:radical SAM protein [Carboxylicivirga sp. M1479]TRX65892.1 radical SAM protein [Carboxylicivirga sp. M1479]